MKRLYESLLDDEDDLIADQSIAINSDLNRLNGDKDFLSTYFDLNSYLYSRFTNRFDPKDHMWIDYNKDKGLILNKAGIQNFHLSRSIKNLKELIDLPYDQVTIMPSSSKNVFILSTKINANTYPKTINCLNSNLYIDCMTELKNININIQGDAVARLTISPIAYQYKFDDVHINLKSIQSIHTSYITSTQLRFTSVDNVPDLSNIYCNAEGLSYYDPSIFDHKEVLELMEKIIDIKNPIPILDNKLKINVLKKFKIPKLVAAVNNPKRYIFTDYQCKLKSNVKLVDILNIKHFNKLEVIKIGNNNVEFIFTNNSTRLKHLIPFIHMYWTINNIPVTADGWYMVIRKIN